MNKHTRSVSLIDGHTEDRTDAEIKKALEDYRNSPIIFTKKGIISIGDIIDLIKRQQAEIAELQHKNSELEAEIELLQKTKQLIKSETIKEFAERLKAKRCGGTYPYVLVNVIDNLVKKMTEVKKIENTKSD